MFKKILSCLIVMLILLTVTACKGEENLNNSDNTSLGNVENSSNSSPDEEVSSLQMYTQIALDRLKNKNGFFLMIENTLADKAGHNNDINGKIDAVPVLDKAVVTVLNFMKSNPDTLLIITSDHETGGVRLPNEDEAVTNALFSTTNHTSTDVKIFALGYGVEYFNGKTVDNTEVANFVINAVKGNW
ncbi:MAG: alkaline phosphatase [Clostridia bacterium]|nr:alkaline phosphatase [Clostridia bacterium]